MMADKTCTNCAYYHPTDKDRLKGECRIKAPLQWSTHNWPDVDALDWCGEFMSMENLYEKKKKK
jgi:hypothetical protein